MNAMINIDFSSVQGPVKPVNGVGQPPILGFDDTRLFRYLKEAGIPYSRLHDVGGAYGKNVFVDIPNLFRDFDADETDPASYDFAFTDRLINALVENGAFHMEFFSMVSMFSGSFHISQCGILWWKPFAQPSV